MLGAGSIVPTRKRFSSGILARLGEELLLFDCGPGVLEKLGKRGVNPNAIRHLFLTHFHVDHFSDFLPMVKLRAFSDRGGVAASPHHLNVYGPPGLAALTETLFTRVPHLSYVSRDLGCFEYLSMREVLDGLVVESKGWSVTSTQVRHFHGVAYRLDAEGKAIVYSGDTVPDPNLIRIARGVDLLVHECSFPDEELMGLHTSTSGLIQVAEACQPKMLVATHLYPAWDGREDPLVDAVRSAFDGAFLVGNDSLVVDL